MKDKKYILTKETKEVDGHILHRIQAIKDFGFVHTGDLGGWVEKEENLSHEGLCWVFDDAWVCGDAQIIENASAYDYAEIKGYAILRGIATIGDNAIISEKAEAYGSSCIGDSARVYGYAKISDFSIIRSTAHIYGDANIRQWSNVLGPAKIYTGEITSTQDYLVVGPIGSRNSFTTFFKANGTIMVSCGCFKGTIEEFEEKVKMRHEFASSYRRNYLDAITFAKCKLK